MKAARTILAVLLGALPLAAPAAAEDGYDIYLTTKAQSGVPLKQPSAKFSCSDKIYGVVEITRPGDSSQHTLYATWRNPSGEDQEFTKYRFQLTNGSARVWVWLKLHRPSEASLVQFMNPSAGMEGFVGRWELHLQVDGETIGKKAFEVIC